MPYIKQFDREKAAPIGATCDTAGELNFALTTIVVEYVQRRGLSYSTINDALGALEGAKLEFYRRVAVPYENKKIAENGDVYPEELTR